MKITGNEIGLHFTASQLLIDCLLVSLCCFLSLAFVFLFGTCILKGLPEARTGKHSAAVVNDFPPSQAIIILGSSTVSSSNGSYQLDWCLFTPPHSRVERITRPSQEY